MATHDAPVLIYLQHRCHHTAIVLPPLMLLMFVVVVAAGSILLCEVWCGEEGGEEEGDAAPSHPPS